MKTVRITVLLAAFCLFSVSGLEAQQSELKEAQPRVPAKTFTKEATRAVQAPMAKSTIATEAVEILETDQAPEFVCPEKMNAGEERKRCAEGHMLRFLYGQIKYPAEARNAGTEGTVVIKFVVEKDGSITRAEVESGIGNGCDEEALRVISMMPNWIPGKRGRVPLAMYYHMPVKFKLH